MPTHYCTHIHLQAVLEQAEGSVNREEDKTFNYCILSTLPKDKLLFTALF